MDIILSEKKYMISIPYYQTVYIPIEDNNGNQYTFSLCPRWYYKTSKNNIFIHINRNKSHMLKDFICEHLKYNIALEKQIISMFEILEIQ